MYKTEVELDAEIEELRQAIAQQSLEADEMLQETQEPNSNADSELADRLRAMFEHNGEKMSDEDIVNAVSGLIESEGKVFKAKTDTDALLTSEAHIKEEFAEFDLVEELRRNALFKRLVANGVDLHTALLASNSIYSENITQRIKRDARREFAEELRKGRERIAPVAANGNTSQNTDIGGMSDEQFAEIEKRVKQNKKIYL